MIRFAIQIKPFHFENIECCGLGEDGESKNKVSHLPLVIKVYSVFMNYLIVHFFRGYFNKNFLIQALLIFGSDYDITSVFIKN